MCQSLKFTKGFYWPLKPRSLRSHSKTFLELCFSSTFLFTPLFVLASTKITLQITLKLYNLIILGVLF